MVVATLMFIVMPFVLLLEFLRTKIERWKIPHYEDIFIKIGSQSTQKQQKENIELSKHCFETHYRKIITWDITYLTLHYLTLDLKKISIDTIFWSQSNYFILIANTGVRLKTLYVKAVPFYK